MTGEDASRGNNEDASGGTRNTYSGGNSGGNTGSGSIPNDKSNDKSNDASTVRGSIPNDKSNDANAVPNDKSNDASAARAVRGSISANVFSTSTEMGVRGSIFNHGLPFEGEWIGTALASVAVHRWLHEICEGLGWKVRLKPIK